MATIYEVAALAEVSPATVSRVFNEASAVSAEKVRKVRRAAKELNFTPDRTARRLRRRTSELIALLIPDIENPFFTALARGVEDRAMSAGYSVVLCNTDDDPVKETHYLDIANSENMAGVILAPSAEDGDIGHVTARKRPVVAVDRNTGFDIDSVMVDNRAIGKAATEALVDKGFRKISCIAGPATLEWTEGRALAWREVVSRRFDGFPTEYLQHANYRVDGGREAMECLLSLPDPPDAVITTNNLMGVGALQALSSAGRTPTDFGVAVVGELPYASFVPGSVIQASLPARNLGTTAAAMLLERIEGDDQPARTVMLRAELLRD